MLSALRAQIPGTLAYQGMLSDSLGVPKPDGSYAFNAIDGIFVQDAVENSQYNSFGGDGLNHKADDAECYLGIPRNFNVGLSIGF